MSHPSCDRLTTAVLQAQPQPKDSSLTEEDLFNEIQRLLELPQTQKLGRRKGLCPHDLDDAASRCFLSLRRKLAKIDARRNWGGYVRASLRNAVRDLARDGYRRRAAPLPAEGGGDRGRTPLEELTARDEARAARDRLLAGASARDRRIAECYLAGDTLAEIAGATGLSVSSVWRAWQKRLRQVQGCVK